MAKFGTSEYKGGGGDWIDRPCICHFVIDEVNEDFLGSDKPRYEIEFRVVASTEPEMVGKFLHKDKGGAFHVSEKAIGRLFELACATGVLNRDYLKKQVEAKEDVEFEPKDMEGLQFIAPVAMRPGKDDPSKHYANLGGEKGFTFYAVGDEECDTLPKDEHTLSYARRQDGALPTRNSDFRKPGTKKAPANGAAANGTRKAPPPAGRTTQTAKRETVPPATDGDDIPF